MTQDGLDYINDLRTATEQGRPASAEAVGELLRIVDDLRQTVSEVCAERDAWVAECNRVSAQLAIVGTERDALKAWKDAVPVGALLEYFGADVTRRYYVIGAIRYWLATLDGAA